MWPGRCVSVCDSLTSLWHTCSQQRAMLQCKISSQCKFLQCGSEEREEREKNPPHLISLQRISDWQSANCICHKTCSLQKPKGSLFSSTLTFRRRVLKAEYHPAQKWEIFDIILTYYEQESFPPIWINELIPPHFSCYFMFHTSNCLDPCHDPSVKWFLSPLLVATSQHQAVFTLLYLYLVTV